MTTSKPLSLSTERNVFNGIYYPDEDGLPLPDGYDQEPHFMRVMTMMRGYLERYYEVIVSGNTFLYYEEGNRRAVVSPDCYVTFGLPRSAILPHNSYFTWHLGRVPDFVMEIGSESTARVDLGRKRDLYESLGIAEYWRYDPTPDRRHYGEPLVGERLEGEEYVRIDVKPGPDGLLRGHSPALGLDICWEEGVLRLYDPVRSIWVPDYFELRDAQAEAEARLTEERAARQAAEARMTEERAARQAAEARMTEERAARRAAEARMAEMEAALRRLRDQT